MVTSSSHHQLLPHLCSWESHQGCSPPPRQLPEVGPPCHKNSKIPMLKNAIYRQLAGRKQSCLLLSQFCFDSAFQLLDTWYIWWHFSHSKVISLWNPAPIFPPWKFAENLICLFCPGTTSFPCAVVTGTSFIEAPAWVHFGFHYFISLVGFLDSKHSPPLRREIAWALFPRQEAAPEERGKPTT